MVRVKVRIMVRVRDAYNAWVRKAVAALHQEDPTPWLKPWLRPA